ncbi:MAG: Rieske 2Fe-2S domain-containing protein [Pseudonocardiaceae bacterium]|nr:Rieske 2Fe-2S domain-containing protein [Pseudonocardiaceae bacterium]
MRIVVARAEDFAPGDRRIVEVDRRSIGVFRVGDRFYAINNHCPHQGGPLCLGRTAPWALSSGPGEFQVSEEHALLACPWHGWEYDLATGQSFLGPGEAPVRSYQVSVEPGEALTDDPDLRMAGRAPGPYVAETFPVRVEDEYVVVDTQPVGRDRRTER